MTRSLREHENMPVFKGYIMLIHNGEEHKLSIQILERVRTSLNSI